MNPQDACVECPHWTPSRGSKYKNCLRHQQSRMKCDLPRSACDTCEHYMRPGTISTGRPNETGIDWTDPDEVREYYANKQREHRKRSEADA